MQPHRLSQNLSPSNSYSDIPNQYASYSDPMARPSIGAGEGYRDSYASSSFDKDGYGGAAAGLGAGVATGTAAGMTSYDPQGRSGARYMDRHEAAGGHMGQDYGAPASKGSKKKWWIIGGVLLGIAAIIAIAVGVTVARKSGNGDSNGKDSSVDIGKDPSVFEKDSRLHNSL
jgi:hypothetical protein